VKPSWIFGVQSVKALLAARPAAARELLVSREARGPREEIRQLALAGGIRVTEAEPRKIAEICGSDTHQGVAALAPLPAYADWDQLRNREPHRLAVLDSITDPQNLGAIIRSAEALGFSGAVIPVDRAAGLSSTAHKASAGAMEWLPVAQVVNLARALRDLKNDGYWIYAADPEGDSTLAATEFSGKIAVVVGSEGKGIRPGVDKEVDFRVRIEAPGHTESLNASVASGIMFYLVASGCSRNRSGS
jgi:23S rRNA (guanosine2251-2'-O)-methyltransferase